MNNLTDQVYFWAKREGITVPEESKKFIYLYHVHMQNKIDVLKSKLSERESVITALKYKINQLGEK